MKIGIITIQKCNNFGADLQAYALGAKLRNLGYDAENIDYLFYKHPRHLKGKGEKPIFKLSLVNRAKEILFPIVAGLKNLKRRAAIHARHERFAAWTDEYLKCGPEYRSVASLYANPPRYDVYVVGSDQVWNPRMGSNILPYFLDFAPKDARLVSYASSMGVAELPAGAFYKFKQLLRRFSAISTREKSAADIVNAMALGVEVKHVVDPTLLLSAAEWMKVSKVPADIPAKPYLLLYDLIASEETVKLARKIAAEKGLSIVRIGDGAYGPGEFIWLFNNADFVVTNSFHGTAFSIINNKDFFSVIPRGMTNAARIESLLKVVASEDRLVRAEHIDNVDSSDSIDWTKVNSLLEATKTESLGFLTRAVESKSNRIEPKLPIGCYAVWNADDDVRAASTSGGLFRVLAERTIARGGVVYGAAFSQDFHHVSHQAAETIDELEPLMKSKYVWSDPTAAYKQALEHLKSGREVLFTGTPCQIAAIKSLAKGYDEKLLTMDIVCHGTPRPEIFESYISELENRFGGKVTHYEFRNKDAGWNFSHVRGVFESSAVYDKVLRNDLYYLAFGIGDSLRPGCFNCPFIGLERVADFTIADCWRVAASNPEFDDGKGTSLVLVNSPKAAAIWKEVLASGKIKGGAYDLDLAQMRNMPLMQKAHKPRSYESFQRVFNETKSFNEAAKVFLTRKLLLKATIVYWVKKLGWFYFKHHQ
ncbi:MAG: polysaccharide pyruvyl transferase family protein [Kiritimatiellae bacterium]|nr:polysaccharide pyruvyl transferase family protein [Kiritimatiellia bacterium]